MLNIWRLQLLVQFEALGTMQRVSDAMYISIATVSQQLSLLEKETNTILFEKKGRRVQLTHEGHLLVKKVKPLLNQLEYIEKSLNDTANVVQGTVRIAAFTSAMQTFVIPAVSELSKTYPDLHIRLTEMEPDMSLPALDAYQFDLAIVYCAEQLSLIEQNNRNCMMLGKDYLMALVNDKSSLAKKNEITIEELKNENWVMEPEGTFLSEYTKRLCRDAGYEPNVINIIQNYLVMHSMIAESLAVGVLPKLAIIDSIEGIHRIKIQPEASRSIYAVTRKVQDTARALQIVAKGIQDYARSILEV